MVGFFKVITSIFFGKPNFNISITVTDFLFWEQALEMVNFAGVLIGPLDLVGSNTAQFLFTGG